MPDTMRALQRARLAGTGPRRGSCFVGSDPPASPIDAVVESSQVSSYIGLPRDRRGRRGSGSARAIHPSHMASVIAAALASGRQALSRKVLGFLETGSLDGSAKLRRFGHSPRSRELGFAARNSAMSTLGRCRKPIRQSPGCARDPMASGHPAVIPVPSEVGNDGGPRNPTGSKMRR